MDTVRTVSQPGAYDYEYEYSVSLVRSRRGVPYMETSGFAWEGNQGGRRTFRAQLTEDGATELLRLMDKSDEASANGGLLCNNPTHKQDRTWEAKLEGMDVCPKCVPWTVSSIPNCMPATAFTCPSREV